MIRRRLSDADWSRFQTRAETLGFVAMAAAPAHQIAFAQELHAWVARGYHAEMHWFARGLEKRCNPEMVLPDVCSVIAFSARYHPEACTLAGKHLARYACGDDYHDVLKRQLKVLCGEIEADYPQAQFRVYVDTGPVQERYWAQQAGLGWIGKNGNLISRKDGSYLFLAVVLTDLEVPYGNPHANFCGQCRACIEACPTGAIVADGVVDSRKCISYLNIEHHGDLPPNTNLAGWIFGCDICQEVCPWQKFVQPASYPAFLPRPAFHELEANDLAAMVQEDFSRLFSKSPVKRTKLAGIQRNLAVLQDAHPIQGQDK